MRNIFLIFISQYLIHYSRSTCYLNPANNPEECFNRTLDEEELKRGMTQCCIGKTFRNITDDTVKGKALEPYCVAYTNTKEKVHILNKNDSIYGRIYCKDDELIENRSLCSTLYPISKDSCFKHPVTELDKNVKDLIPFDKNYDSCCYFNATPLTFCAPCQMSKYNENAYYAIENKKTEKFDKVTIITIIFIIVSFLIFKKINNY